MDYEITSKFMKRFIIENWLKIIIVICLIIITVRVSQIQNDVNWIKRRGLDVEIIEERGNRYLPSFSTPQLY